ncbi:MAG: hypothetical protein AMXMBFR46_15450 [Acidimicrobiia bacterium]
MQWRASDEGRHDGTPGLEGWTFEFGHGRTSGRVRLTLDVVHGRAAFLADLFVGGQGRIVVADESVPVPRAAAGLEIRAEGLWASMTCETPFEHWSLGLEAFGLRIDTGTAAGAGAAAGAAGGGDTDARDGIPAGDRGSWAELRGERLPVGFDLEWELRAPPTALADGAGYTQRGVCFGDVLVARERIALDAPASREHWWGGPRRRSGLRD